MHAEPISVTVTVPAGLDAAPRQMLSVAQAYQIDCPDLYEAAAEDLKAVKAKYKAIEEQRQTIVKPLNDAVNGDPVQLPPGPPATAATTPVCPRRVWTSRFE